MAEGSTSQLVQVLKTIDTGSSAVPRSVIADEVNRHLYTIAVDDIYLHITKQGYATGSLAEIWNIKKTKDPGAVDQLACLQLNSGAEQAMLYVLETGVIQSSVRHLHIVYIISNYLNTDPYQLSSYLAPIEDNNVVYDSVVDVRMVSATYLSVLKSNYNPAQDIVNNVVLINVDMWGLKYSHYVIPLATGIVINDAMFKLTGYPFVGLGNISPNSFFYDSGQAQSTQQGFIFIPHGETNCFGGSSVYTENLVLASVTAQNFNYESSTYLYFEDIPVESIVRPLDLTPEVEIFIYEIPPSLLLDYSSICQSKEFTIATPTSGGQCELHFDMDNPATQSQSITRFDTPAGCSVLSDNYTITGTNNYLTIEVALSGDIQIVASSNIPTKQIFSLTVANTVGQFYGSYSISTCICPTLPTAGLLAPHWNINLGDLSTYQYEILIPGYDLYSLEFLAIIEDPGDEGYFKAHLFVPKILFSTNLETSAIGMVKQGTLTLSFSLQSAGCLKIMGFSIIVNVYNPVKMCRSDPYPKILACPTNENGENIQLTHIDRSTNDWIAVGGYASDACLFSNPAAPSDLNQFIAVYNDQGRMQWARRSTLSQLSLLQLDYSPLGNILGAFFLRKVDGSYSGYLLLVDGESGNLIGVGFISTMLNRMELVNKKIMHTISSTQVLFGDLVNGKPFMYNFVRESAYWNVEKYQSETSIATGMKLQGVLIEANSLVAWYLLHQQSTNINLYRVNLEQATRDIMGYTLTLACYAGTAPLFDILIVNALDTMVLVTGKLDQNVIFVSVCIFNQESEACSRTALFTQELDYGVNEVLDISNSLDQIKVLVSPLDPTKLPIVYSFYWSDTGVRWHSIKLETSLKSLGTFWLNSGEQLTLAYISRQYQQTYYFIMQKQALGLQTSYSSSLPTMGIAGMVFTTRFAEQCDTVTYLADCESNTVTVLSNKQIEYRDSDQVSNWSLYTTLIEIMTSFSSDFSFLDIADGDYFNQAGGLKCNSQEIVQLFSGDVHESQTTTGVNVNYLASTQYLFSYTNFTITSSGIGIECDATATDDFIYELFYFDQGQNSFLEATDNFKLLQETSQISVSEPTVETTYLLLLIGYYRYNTMIKGQINFQFTASAAVQSGLTVAPSFTYQGTLTVIEVPVGQTVAFQLSTVSSPINGEVIQYQISPSALTGQVTFTASNVLTGGTLTFQGHIPAKDGVFEIQYFSIFLYVDVSSVFFSTEYVFQVLQKPAIQEVNPPESLQELIPMVFMCDGYSVTLDTVDASENYIAVGGTVPSICTDLAAGTTDPRPFVILHSQPTYQVLWRKSLMLGPTQRMPLIAINEDETTLAVMTQSTSLDAAIFFIDLQTGIVTQGLSVSTWVDGQIDLDLDSKKPQVMRFGKKFQLFVNFYQQSTSKIGVLIVNKDSQTAWVASSTFSMNVKRSPEFANDRIYFMYQGSGSIKVESIQDNLIYPIYDWAKKTGGAYNSYRFVCSSSFAAIGFIFNLNSPPYSRTLWVEALFFHPTDKNAITGTKIFQVVYDLSIGSLIQGSKASDSGAALYLHLFDNSDKQMRIVKIVMEGDAEQRCLIRKIAQQPQWNLVRRVIFLKEEFAFVAVSTEPKVSIVKNADTKFITSNFGLLMVRSSTVQTVEDYTETIETALSTIPTPLNQYSTILTSGLEIFSVSIDMVNIDSANFYNDVLFTINDINGFHKFSGVTVVPPSITEVVIDIDSGVTQVTLPKFTVSPTSDQEATFRYEITTDLECIQTDNYQRVLNIDHCQIKARSEVKALYKGFFFSSSEGTEQSLRIVFAVNPRPPSFTSKLQDSIYINEGTTYTMTLPAIVDPDGDSFTLSVASSSPADFKISFNKKSIEIYAYPNLKKAGLQTSQLFITLKDIYTLGTSKDQQYTVIVSVYYTKSLENQNALSQMNAQQLALNKDSAQREAQLWQNYLDSHPEKTVVVITEDPDNITQLIQLIMTLEEYSSWSEKQQKDFKKKNQSFRVTFRVQKLTPSGELTLRFNYNSEDLVQEVVQLKALKFTLMQDGLEEVPLNFEVLSQSGDSLKCQLHYENPYSLSLSQERDVLYIKSERKINILKNGFNLTFNYGDRDQVQVPPYLDEGQMLVMEQAEGVFRTATFVFVSGNAVVNIFMQA